MNEHDVYSQILTKLLYTFMNIERIRELEKCHNDFSYFASNYVKILHPLRGLLGFDLHPYQKRLWETYDRERFVILRKWRNGGFTTLSAIWAVYQSIFKLDQHIMIASPRRVDATHIKEHIIDPVLHFLPEWMQPSIGINNQHRLEFSETGCNIYFTDLEPAKGRYLNCLIIDEAAFHKKMERNWKAIYPCLSTGGKCFVVSTPNGVGNWFQDTYHRAQDKKNNFFVFESDYRESPEWQDEKKNEQIRNEMGTHAWFQEVLGCFVYDPQKEPTTDL